MSVHVEGLPFLPSGFAVSDHVKAKAVSRFTSLVDVTRRVSSFPEHALHGQATATTVLVEHAHRFCDHFAL